ncbi:MAG: hypothetical protein AAGI01_09860 [Myxococcota bacterium]
MLHGQADLFPEARDLPNVDASRQIPRIWIERVVLYHSPKEILRDVRLKRGLNIIWTPDATPIERDDDDVVTIGHGAGKTMLCRLMRYCMCERGWRGSQLHRRVRAKFPHAFVGAQVVVGDTTWAVLRPIGESRAEYLGTNTTVEQLWDLGPSEHGVTPLAEALREAALGDLGARVIPGRDELISWSHVLAWLTRDQECRFHGVLAWRGTSLEAKSPVLHNYSHEAKAHIARALLGMITQEEAAQQTAHDALLERRRWHESRQRYLAQVSQGQLEELAQAHGINVASMPAGPLLVQQVRARAQLALDELAQGAAAKEIKAQLATTRRDRDATAEEHAELGRQLGAATRGEALTTAAGDAFARQLEALDGLAETLHGVLSKGAREVAGAALDARREELAAERDAARAQAEQARRSISELTQRRAQLAQDIADLDDELVELDRELDREIVVQRDVHYRTRRLRDEIERVDATLTELEGHRGALDRVHEEIKESLELLQDARETHRARLARFERLYDATIKELVGQEAQGRERVHQRGLDVDLELDGRRVSAALESLKVVAFDLAALLFAMEGEAALPGLLIHDSPREADLGASLYARIFDFVHGLAQVTPEPAFQYIITTTTAPPEHFRAQDVVLRLRGTPTSERLLKAAL